MKAILDTFYKAGVAVLTGISLAAALGVWCKAVYICFKFGWNLV